jgi:acetoin utilization deacetylase AcuC-like enzyme|tara:strand:- start:2063 stop:3025 length:963 start_codon:yes stop_codon:yes gene_type:complete
MNFIYNKIFLKHKTSNHPECPARLSYFDKNTGETKLENGEKYLNLIYNKDYIGLIKKSSEKELHIDADTYTNKYSYEAACFSVASAIKASEQNSFSLGRPPGHHATKSKAMGFCLFNNIAIATKNLISKGKKVFIIDFDGHHGNGTQEIFYNSGNVLYLSTHQFSAFPGTGWIDEIGENKGKGFNINIPLPPETGDDLFLQSLNTFIPIINKQFKPDIVGVSAGFDGHYSDSLLQLNLTTNAYYEIGKLLSNNFNNIFACLEGGYNLKFIHRNILDFVNGVSKKEQQFKEEFTKSDNDVKNDFKLRMSILKENLKDYWTL